MSHKKGVEQAFKAFVDALSKATGIDEKICMQAIICGIGQEAEAHRYSDTAKDYLKLSEYVDKVLT